MGKAKERRRRRAELKKAESELTAIQTALDQAYSRFDHASDPVLTDAYIYEINALRARYDHAVKGLKMLFQ